MDESYQTFVAWWDSWRAAWIHAMWCADHSTGRLRYKVRKNRVSGKWEVHRIA